MKKIYILIICVSLLLLNSCMFMPKRTVINNEVHGDTIHVEGNIDILTFEDALCAAVDKADDYVIGVVTKASTIIGSESFGSGVVVRRDEVDNGYKYLAITNGHVVSDNGTSINSNLYVALTEQLHLVKTSVVKYCPNEDLALIEFTTKLFLPCATINKEIPRKGSFAIAIGNPYSIDEFYNTAAVGNISYPRRLISEDSLRGKPVQNYYIQTTAAINPGNSGGGLFNLNGDLIGINTWKIVDPDEGIELMGFSIPMDVVLAQFSTYIYK